MKSEIKTIKAREVLDSRGNPTVEVDLTTDSGLFRAIVPSGASTGTFEAIELRDRDMTRYLGKGVQRAVANINQKIAPQIIGLDCDKQTEIDSIMIELDGTEYMQMTDGANGQFNVSLIQGESIKKLTIYSQQYAPVSVPVSSSVLSGATATNTINCTNGVCNITMREFGEYDPFNQSHDIMMDMFSSNASCNIPNPPSNYSLIGAGMNKSSFSPFNAILKGDINMMISYENLSVYYINVDLLASGPPDAAFNENSETSSGGLEAAWQFGSQGPDIYDYVIIGMPYESQLENKSIIVKIEKLFDNEFNVIWNSSAGNTTADIETDPDLEEYIDYINSSWSNSDLKNSV